MQDFFFFFFFFCLGRRGGGGGGDVESLKTHHKERLGCQFNNVTKHVYKNGRNELIESKGSYGTDYNCIMCFIYSVVNLISCVPRLW